jgi:hypothetical protein
MAQSDGPGKARCAVVGSLPGIARRGRERQRKKERNRQMGRQPARDPDPPVATGEGAERQYSINTGTLSIDRMVHQSGHRPT